ncbi:YdeI/OmpD-associated family protein [uncultured Fibrobacter sp.]|uniref:YdeI/OmpD-associated family protein n=1 Tax=uncultured Fibrobacter sp. TaxID=261512 RepID=UPI002803D12D|nr:YdeI/OmpD-associated family protein [uncultured Fibrobacter sp.]
MEILPIKNRGEFRRWLSENPGKEKECWIIVQRGRPVDDGTFWYIDAVEEALCFGWIDCTTKKRDSERRSVLHHVAKKSVWSELNKERCRRMEKLGKMTDAGRAVLSDMSKKGFAMDADVLAALQADKKAWHHFLTFPVLYQRIRIDTVQIKKKNPKVFRFRLQKLIENSRNGVMYGEWNDNGRLSY